MNRFGLAGLVLGVTAAICGVGWWYFHRDNAANNSIAADVGPVSFEGDSDRLKQTVIVPTLDTPLPAGKSVIWCSSFQLAWNRLKDDLAKGDVLLKNAQPIADRLNRAVQSADDVEVLDVYATAGFVNDGIVNEIKKQMSQRFSSVKPLEIDDSPDGAVAYAYLRASVKFDLPFFENEEPLTFTDDKSSATPVRTFGVVKAADELRRQVEVHYFAESREWASAVSEFVLDPCKTSQPYQIILARVDRKGSLAETLADIEQKVAKASLGSPATLRHIDTLLVPNMSWRTHHHFHELEGRDKHFLNPTLQGLFLHAAVQTTAFRLNSSGAELESQAKIEMKASEGSPTPRNFHLNRPFLIYMKKRGGKRPFFVMWVENAELLEKK